VKRYLSATEIHARVDWSSVLQKLGVEANLLLNKNKTGPCPICVGKTRFRFDDLDGRGTWICSHCGAGDGFGLLMRLHGWDFPEARKQVLKAADIYDDESASGITRPIVRASVDAPARPTPRVLQLLRESCNPENCVDTVEYLNSRNL
jgi:phage/plasmid primase-like uncharacterized protein